MHGKFTELSIGERVHPKGRDSSLYEVAHMAQRGDHVDVWLSPIGEGQCLVRTMRKLCKDWRK